MRKADEVSIDPSSAFGFQLLQITIFLQISSHLRFTFSSCSISSIKSSFSLRRERRSLSAFSPIGACLLNHPIVLPRNHFFTVVQLAMKILPIVGVALICMVVLICSISAVVWVVLICIVISLVLTVSFA